jgi:ATP-dependent helicase Lhr and Lhr-like helicase
MTKTAFDRLHHGLKRHLWDMRWTKLRPVQVKAIHHLLDERGDCVISVPTAGGKTEAAFLPILSRIADAPFGSVRAIYLGPLKALINDQFRRVEQLCARMELPVHKWHGDVGAGARKRLLDAPSGILLITPESLEAMFVLRPTKMSALFARLAYVVIDEPHAFIGTERGAQLQSQLERLCTRAACNPCRIGLSATLGDPQLALRWLRPPGASATLLEDPEAARELQVRVRGFWTKPHDESDADGDQRNRDDLTEVARAMLLAIHGTTNLVFANAKSRIEGLADAMREEAPKLGVRDEIVVHHGSLSKEVREHAEGRLSSGAPCTAVCSNTLEMGIDVGRIESVVQLAAPPSVAALVQRVGRSGRNEGAPAKLRGFFLEPEHSEDTPIWNRLHLDFLRGLASIELMRERFVEPIAGDRWHGSTLIQQILSILAETGGIRAALLHARLQKCGAFGPLEPPTFAALLRELAVRELIEQMPEGDLILAPRGQKVIEHHSFYAAFKTPDEVAVFHRSDKIGSLPSDSIPALHEHVILAGRRWSVQQINVDRREIVVEPAKGKRPPIFRSGFQDAHPVVHAKMRALATGSETPSYLDPIASEILTTIRAETARSHRFEPPLLANGAGSILFAWAGARVARTLYLYFRERDIELMNYDVGLEIDADPPRVRELLTALVEGGAGDPMRLASRAIAELGARVTEGEKYDQLLPEDLWAAAYARERLDLDGATAVARRATHQ